MMYISLSESNRPQTSVVMINKKSFILKIDIEGLKKTNTVCPQEDIDYELTVNDDDYYVKIIGVDLV